MGPAAFMMIASGLEKVSVVGVILALFSFFSVKVSTIRRDDYEFHAGKSVYEEVLQCNNHPSTMTSRGHMTPSAFMILASGLDKVCVGRFSDCSSIL